VVVVNGDLFDFLQELFVGLLNVGLGGTGARLSRGSRRQNRAGDQYKSKVNQMFHP
jgi:hypothetical protein